MKKVGILTFHDSDNFGSVLQAYATCRMLNNSGFLAEIIDLRKPEVEQLYRIIRFPKSPSTLMANLYNFLHYRKLAYRKKSFEQFRQEHMSLSKDRFADGKALEAAGLSYDAYIVGSDQVWNVDILDFDQAYFLPFAESARRIAYAASFGPRQKDPTVLCAVSEHLCRFDLLTVREQLAADLVAGVCNIGAEVVLDPVFFLSREQWRELAAPVNQKRPYMLCYFPGVVTKEFDEYTRKLAEERGLERVVLVPHWRNILRCATKCYDAGPREFLGLMSNAEMVCTNSFHAVAFSVILQKEFIAGTHEYRADARINTILERTGLDGCEFHTMGYEYNRPDMDRAAQELEKDIQHCRGLLLNALNWE